MLYNVSVLMYNGFNNTAVKCTAKKYIKVMYTSVKKTAVRYNSRVVYVLFNAAY